MKQHKTVTLKDIARETGYSINTVSRALRGKDDIAEETRNKIQDIAREMGHVSNTLAASLRLGYTNTIAVIFGDISNPHFAVMMKEIENHAWKSGYTSILFNTNEDEGMELAAIRSALNKNVDGIIICPAQKTPDNLRYLENSGVPFVLIGRRNEAYNYVVCNDELGGYQATNALLEAGHENILLLHGATYISSAKERLEGYCRAYEEAGIPVNEDLICKVPVVSDGCEAVLAQLEEKGQIYSAIFAFSDMLAFEAWCGLQKLGKKVPEDCSIIGFDHIESRLKLPLGLTSISSHKGRMSVKAVDILMNHMQGKIQKQQEVIDTTLAVGRTVRALIPNDNLWERK